MPAIYSIDRFSCLSTRGKWRYNGGLADRLVGTSRGSVVRPLHLLSERLGVTG